MSDRPIEYVNWDDWQALDTECQRLRGWALTGYSIKDELASRISLGVERWIACEDPPVRQAILEKITTLQEALNTQNKLVERLCAVHAAFTAHFLMPEATGIRYKVGGTMYTVGKL